MATRSLIAKKNKDSTYTAVYCHFDGYEKGVGKVLREHYLDEAKIDLLLSKGGMSFLAETVEGTEFYTKRGEDLRVYENILSHEELVEAAKNVGGEFVYVYNNGVWNSHKITWENYE